MVTGNESINVKKRNDRGTEPLNIEKIHEMVEYACEDITGVSSSQVEMKSGLQFYDGISTDEIQQILVKSAADLIDLNNPNYTYVASRLLLYSLRKQVIGKLWDHPHFFDHVKKVVDLGLYDKEIFTNYQRKDFDRMENWISHNRDYDFTYAGLRQVIDKYLVQDRSTNVVYETPQFMYMMIAATLFAKYPKERRMSYVKKYYDAISTFKINIPTPVMAGVRTPLKQYASCVLVDIDDTLPSIFSSDMAVGRYVAQRAGIGINAGRIRGINSRIRGGEVQHTGVIPFLKKFEATVKCCTQNGVRGGSATVHFPIWHQEIEDIIVLKNNKPYLILGSPGGPSIITSVFQTILNVLEYGMSVNDAVSSPRFHHQWYPDLIVMENEAYSDELNTILSEKNYLIVKLPIEEDTLGVYKWSDIGAVDAIRIDDNLKVYGGADLRREHHSSTTE